MSVAVTTCDGCEISIEKEIAIKSHFLKSMIEEQGATGTLDKIFLKNGCCTLQTVEEVVLYLKAEEGMMDLEKSDARSKLQLIRAAIFLDIAELLTKFAKHHKFLLMAATEEDPDVMRALIDHKADVICKASSGQALESLITSEACLAELERGKLIKYGWTPLMIEAKNDNHTKLINLLEASGTWDINAKNKEGQSALHYAASFGTAQTALLLIQAQADTNMVNSSGKTPLHLAVQSPSAKDTQAKIEALLGGKADIDFCPAVYASGQTALGLAAKCGNADAVAALLAARADVDAGDPTPLIASSDRGSPAVARALLAARADPDAERDGSTALHSACRGGHAEVVAALIEAGAGVNIPADYSVGLGFLQTVWVSGETPLHAAIPAMSRGGDGDGGDPVQVVRLLLAARADVAATTEWEFGSMGGPSGRTALHQAAENGNAEAVRALLAAGADPSAVADGPDGPTPLDLARQAGHRGVVHLLAAAAKRTRGKGSGSGGGIGGGGGGGGGGGIESRSARRRRIRRRQRAAAAAATVPNASEDRLGRQSARPALPAVPAAAATAADPTAAR